MKVTPVAAAAAAAAGIDLTMLCVCSPMPSAASSAVMGSLQGVSLLAFHVLVYNAELPGLGLFSYAQACKLPFCTA